MSKTTGIPRESGVYLIENTKTYDEYVGSSNNIQKRIQKHLFLLRTKNHPNQHLQNSWNKYGEENFEFLCIELCGVSDIRKLEQYYIDEIQPIFNKNSNAVSNLGTKHTEITKKRISEKIRNWYTIGGTSLIEKLVKSRNYHPTSNEVKDKISNSMKKFWKTEEGKVVKEKQREKRNNTFTKELRISNSVKAAKTRKERGYTHSNDTKEKIKIAHLGKILSPEHKKKISEANIIRWRKIKMEKLNE